MKKIIWLTVPFLTMLSLILFMNKQKEYLLKEGLPVYGEEIAFTLTDSLEESFEFQKHNGTIRLVSFFFTSCPEVCPALNGKLKKLHKEFLENEEIQLVSISVDPKRDTPEVLKKYAERFEASDRWHFLTGEQESIQTILKNNFMLGSSGLPDIHSSAVMLVDRGGRLRGFYRVMEEGGVEQLKQDLELLL